MQVLSKEQRADELYRVAYQCEELKTKKCARINCNYCPFYLPNYAIDQSDAVLIQASAAINYHKKSVERDAGIATNILIFILFAILSIVIFKGCAPSKKPPTQTPIPYDEISRVINIVHENVFDINDDGLVNCIDYAILFCIGYPKSHIILNNNPRTGMNHLFNSINVNGTIMYIEPQRNSKGPLMVNVWGSQYNPAYNEVQTHYYLYALTIASFFVDDTPEYKALKQQAIKIIRDRLNGN